MLVLPRSRALAGRHLAHARTQVTCSIPVSRLLNFCTHLLYTAREHCKLTRSPARFFLLTLSPFQPALCFAPLLSALRSARSRHAPAPP